MLEIPESAALARQLAGTVRGRTVVSAEAGRSPHKFAFFTGDPAEYGPRLSGGVIGGAAAYGGIAQLAVGGWWLGFQDGVNLRYLAPGTPEPRKHQLLLRLDDGSALAATVAMYGALFTFREGENDNPYYLAAREKPAPLSSAFDEAYFASLCAGCDGFGKLSAKAFLATGQRIPGLGNGVLQDILFTAGVHPARRMATLPDAQLSALFASVKSTLAAMAAGGGRDTERGLFGEPGGYRCILSRAAAGRPCPVCGTAIEKKAYLGGSVYYCPRCQPLEG